MTWRARSVVGIAFALLLIGCSTPADRSPGPVRALPHIVGGPPDGVDGSCPVADEDRECHAQPGPDRNARLSDLDAPWTGIRWRSLPPTTHCSDRTVTRWRGGYIGRGDPAALTAANLRPGIRPFTRGSGPRPMAERGSRSMPMS